MHILENYFPAMSNSIINACEYVHILENSKAKPLLKLYSNVHAWPKRLNIYIWVE
jgi:hypothetical protein